MNIVLYKNETLVKGPFMYNGDLNGIRKQFPEFPAVFGKLKFPFMVQAGSDIFTVVECVSDSAVPPAYSIPLTGAPVRQGDKCIIPVEYIDQELDTAKQDAIARVAVNRAQARNNMHKISVSGREVHTTLDPDTTSKMTSAATGARFKIDQGEPSTTMRYWGSQEMTLDEFIQFSLACLDVVDTYYANEREKTAAIAACTSVDELRAVDLSTGW